MKHYLWIAFNVAMVLAMTLAPLSAAAPAPRGAVSSLATELVKQPPPPDASKRAPQVLPPTQTPAHVSGEAALAKLYPSLRALYQQAGPVLPGPAEQAVSREPIIVNIIAVADAKTEAVKPGEDIDPGKQQDQPLVNVLKPYFVDGKLFAQPSFGKVGQKLQVMFGLIMPYNLLKVASFANVVAIYPATPERNEYEPYPADEPKAKQTFGPDDWAKLRENADKLRAGSLPWDQARAFGDGREKITPQDWFEVKPEGPHKAEAAWARGYRGEGVTIAVIDDGVDMAHPDLMGTQKIYSSTVAPQYNGWPMVMDPFTMRAYFYDLMFGTTYVSGSFGGSTYIDTRAKPALTPVGSGISSFKYTPMIDFNVPGIEHTYIISNAMTKSGVVHAGTHTDESLRDYVWGEKVAVLVGDPNTAGVYDTVWVDLDDDYDFRDEKPLTKATPGNPATYNNMVAYRDMNGDGKADLSGGLLYWIADGANWVPGMDWLFYPAGYGLTPPAAGDLIAMHGPWDSGYSHGTQCASNAVANGVIDGMLPKFSDLPGTGYPAAAVYGAAPNADLVPMNTAWSFTGRITYNDAYILAAVGWDAVDQTGWHWFYGPGYQDTDGIQITSNSYGWSGDDNDGWDFLGQYIWQIQRYYAPYLQFLFSTGNGAPGYGTSAPPSPGLGVMVGSSTEYGSTGWDSITSTTQINFNDYTAFSNGGPGARNGAGVDVLAGGSFAAGAEELNYYAIDSWGVLDGNISWATWGGTSRSSPTAMGNLALIYQAYKAKHGVWPTADQARAILMSSATDINNGVLKQGAGSVNADRGTAVAGGHYGIYMGGDSATWEPGDYRGTLYPGFAQIVQPGGTYTKTFTVRNDSASPINVAISDQALQLIGSKELDFTVTPTMTQQESVYGSANRDNFYKAFQYLIPITATAGMDASMYNVAIPAGTDLMVVRQIFPYNEFDVNGDYVYDQRYYLMVYNWKDVNGDGNVWEDKNSNGVVNFINGTEWTSVDVGPELLWDDPRTELDRWEYERFGYNRPTANVNELTVQDPLNRMHDGLFIGLRHLFTSRGASVTTHLKYRIDFYQKADVPWLSASVTNLTVPATGTAVFTGVVNVPINMPPGDYEAAFEIADPGMPPTYTAHTSIVPVVMNVAADFDGSPLTLGGQASYAYDQNRPYNNAAVRGHFEWGWREESGDWRFFYVDANNECSSWVTPTVTLLTENFDGVTAPALPAGWATAVVNGTDTELPWVTNVGRTYPSGAAYSDPNTARFRAYSIGPTLDQSSRLYTTSGLDLSAATSPQLTFWMYHDTGYSSSNDRVQPQVSTNGTTWTNVGAAIPRYDGTTGWAQHAVDLSAYVGQPSVQIGFLGISGYGNDVYVDDVLVTAATPQCTQYTFPPDAHVLVKDVWNDAAPRTDIDTVVLGPTDTQLDTVTFGAWSGDWSEPPFFGPYVLDTVAKSAVDRSGRATWRFNTTSGKNEEWVMFPVSSAEDPFGGLHRILQHNVLFEGDKFDVVFTKTVGLLTESAHSLAITTYVDSGLVGQVALQATLPLNGLSASAYLIGVDQQNFVNEPLPFTGAGTIEWTHVFTVTDGVSIDLTTSSADVPDLDLFLYRRSGTAWVQVASSAGVDANEHILYNNPVNGQYMVGIDNYSGPAGHFNLTKIVKSKVPGLTVTGTTTNTVAANTPVTLTINYNYPMMGGQTYDGMVLAGPPEAPQLKQIPVTIKRLKSSADIEKKVDEPVAFPGNELKYTVDLFNLSDPAAYFEFSDPIPANTTFVTATNATYDPATKKVMYTGTLPIGGPPPSFEGFEGGVVPPQHWTRVQNNTAETWQIDSLNPHGGTYDAACLYDAALNPQDEWLLSPGLLGLTGGEPVSLWSMGSVYWGVTPNDNYDINVWLVVGSLGGGDDVLLGTCDGDWPANWTWAQSTFTLPATLPVTTPHRIGIQYVGVDGAEADVDDISLPGTLDVPPNPSRSIEVTVRVTDTVAPGTWITNTGTLTATHMMHETQVEPTASASAGSQVSLGPVLSTSYKTATAQVATGGEIVYEVHVKNTGTELAVVTLTDPVPANTTYSWHNYNPPYQYFSYNAVQDQMEWSGNVAPGAEWVFTFGVDVDADPTLWGKTITNTATLAWGSSTLPLVATTKIGAPYNIFLPIVLK